MDESNWENPKEFWFTGVVYLSKDDEEQNLTHFWIGTDQTLCGIKSNCIKPSKHALVTCENCSKNTFYYRPDEELEAVAAMLRRGDEFKAD